MLLIYSEKITPRTTYVFDFIFKDVLGTTYKAITDKQCFINCEDEKINYSGSRFGDEIFIKSNELLFDHSIRNNKVSVSENDGMINLFPDQISDTCFDIFAATFYMISRYEEYLPFTADKFGRFSSTESVVAKYHVLQKPVVNIWLERLKKILKTKYPAIQYKEQEFNATFTYDIDIAYAYKGRSFFRNIRSTIKDIILLNFKNIVERMKVLRSSKEDPWDIYNWLAQTTLKNKIQTTFFFLVGNYSKNDKSLSYQSVEMKEVVSKVSTFSDIGIHPSFQSNKHSEKIFTEKRRLECIVGKKIVKSRQHYLKFSLPDTYNRLAEAGITEEYSMGFADMPGFRAGTCTPFHFYDLKNEAATALKVYPVSCMDATFIKYLKFDTDKSLKNIIALIEEVKKVNGTFISIWHNNYLADKRWKDVHDKIVDKAITLP